MSRKQKLLILIIMSLSVYFVFIKTNKNNITYISLGDGLAKGIDCYGINDYGYSDYIKDYLKDNNKLKFYSKEFTSKEMTIESLLNTLFTNKEMTYNDKKYNIKTILQKTNYLTLSIGLNDLLYKLSLTSEYSDEKLDSIMENISESYNNLINEIKKTYRHKIYVVGYYPANDDQFMKQNIDRLNKILQANKDVIYINTEIIYENKSIFLTNSQSYYPNYKGYRLISSKIIDKMTK